MAFLKLCMGATIAFLGVVKILKNTELQKALEKSLIAPMWLSKTVSPLMLYKKKSGIPCGFTKGIEHHSKIVKGEANSKPIC